MMISATSIAPMGSRLKQTDGKHEAWTLLPDSLPMIGQTVE
jgi:hypothetical protein